MSVKLSYMLNNAGVNLGNLINELHYDLPDHDLLHGSSFKYDNPVLIRENRSLDDAGLEWCGLGPI